MLVQDADAGETAACVKRKAFGRRIQRDDPWSCRREQRVHQPGPVTASLNSFRDDDHSGRSIAIAVRPPERGPDHHTGALQNESMAQLQCEIPVLDSVGPRHLLRKPQSAFQMRSRERNEDHVFSLAISGLVSCRCHDAVEVSCLGYRTDRLTRRTIRRCRTSCSVSWPRRHYAIRLKQSSAGYSIDDTVKETMCCQRRSRHSANRSCIRYPQIMAGMNQGSPR